MKPIIDLHNDWKALDEAEIRSFLSSFPEVQVEVRLPSLGYSNSYIDICDELREASYVLEKLSSSFNCTQAIRIHSPFNNRFTTSISEFDANDLFDELIHLQWALKSSEDCGFGPDLTMNIRNTIDDFEEKIHSMTLAHPHIIDDYFANKVGGAYYEVPSELVYHAQRHPERALGFWKSPYHGGEQIQPLNSLHSSIIPKSIGLEKAMERQGWDGALQLLSANLLIEGGTARFITEGAILTTPAANVHRPLSCVHLMDLEIESFEFQEVEGHYISELKDFAFIETSDYWIEIHEIAEEPPHSYSRHLIDIASKIESQTFIDDAFEMDWTTVDDERFEEICYDVIYRTPTFDNQTIKKMGKSRSRDGGRDIVVNTIESPGNLSKMFIFQCKFLAPGRSLTTANLGPISDVIEQYGARGYGVMTTGIIDATVYDRLEAIGKHREISIRTFSRMEIERFLARRPELLKKYMRKHEP